MVKGKVTYIPKEFNILVEEYKKSNDRTSDAIRKIVSDAKIGREFGFIAREKMPEFLKNKKIRGRLNL